MPWNLGNSRFLNIFGGFIIPLIIWSSVWTGLALWHAARRGEKGWFIFFLFVHTAGIAEILYLLFAVRIFETRNTPAKSAGRKG